MDENIIIPKDTDLLNYAVLKELVKQVKAADSKTATDAADELAQKIGTLKNSTTVAGEINALDYAFSAKMGEVPDDKTVADFVAASVATEKERAEGVEGDLQGAITAETAARVAQIGALGKVSEDEGAADHTVKSYVDTKISAVNGDNSALESRVEDTEDAIETINGEGEGSIAKALEDAKDYADGLDEAMDTRVAALEGTHATKDDGSLQTVAEEVATGIAALKDGADEAFDTLKEIAEWIQSTEGNAEGFDAAKRIIALESSVASNDSTAKGLIEDEAEAREEAVSKEQERAEAAEKANADAIEAIDAYVGKASVPAGTDPEANPGSAATGLTAKVEALEARVAANEAAVVTPEDVKALFA